MATDDNLRRKAWAAELRPKSSVMDLLDAIDREPASAPNAAASDRQPEPEPADNVVPFPAAEDGVSLPQAGDAYAAHARPSNKQETMLGLLMRAVPFEGFAYGDLRRLRLLPAERAGGGPVLHLRFVEAEVTDAIIEGRNLLTLADYLRQHRLAWLRERPDNRQVTDPNAVVIDRITIRRADVD